MNDLFGEEIRIYHFIERSLFSFFSNFGYEEIRTPTLERFEVFKESVGDETDIVQKQMFFVETESERLVLRPEETSACLRAVIEHKLHLANRPLRFFYSLPMYRYERPQKGRLRQFHQLGAEILLEGSPSSDAEVISILNRFLRSLGLSQFKIEVNSVGCTLCRPEYKKKLIAFLEARSSLLCEQCRGRMNRSPLRVLDCKNESCREAIRGAPLILDSLCPECSTHHQRLKAELELLNVPFQENALIVRGLDYYVRTAFEFTSTSLGAQSAVAGGGRYDALSVRFGAEAFPCVGWALGIERLVLMLKEENKVPLSEKKVSFYWIALGDNAFRFLFPLHLSLREKGVPVHLNYDPQLPLKKGLKKADKMGSTYCIIVGDDELKNNQFILKDLMKGSQELFPLTQLEEKTWGVLRAP